MEVLKARIAKRRTIFEWYREALGDIDAITFMPELPDTVGNRWLTTLTFDRIDPNHVRLALEKEGIESRPLWKPMHAQPLFKEARSLQNGVSDTLFDQGLCLPSGTQMDHDTVMRIAQLIHKAL